MRMSLQSDVHSACCEKGSTGHGQMTPHDPVFWHCTDLCANPTAKWRQSKANDKTRRQRTRCLSVLNPPKHLMCLSRFRTGSELLYVFEDYLSAVKRLPLTEPNVDMATNNGTTHLAFGSTCSDHVYWDTQTVTPRNIVHNNEIHNRFSYTCIYILRWCILNQQFPNAAVVVDNTNIIPSHTYNIIYTSFTVVAFS